MAAGSSAPELATAVIGVFVAKVTRHVMLTSRITKAAAAWITLVGCRRPTYKTAVINRGDVGLASIVPWHSNFV